MARTTALLLLCFILAQADKQVLGLLSLPIQASFGLSNSQLGFLQGGAFAIAFAIGGLPVARLVDTGNRVRLAAICVALWSLATILCGLAASFGMLVAFRAATAIAEAGLPPAAFSIFSQQRDGRMVARSTGTFMLAPFIGAGLMLTLGGWLFVTTSRAPLALLAGWEPWRIVFICVGLPGVLLAPLLAFLGREPERSRAAAQAMPTAGYRAVFAHIFVERPFLRYYYLGMAAFYLASASLLAWYPALLVREMGLTMGGAGLHAGVTYLGGGVTGTLLATGYFSSRRGLTPHRIIKTFLMVAIALTPVLILMPMATTLPLSLGAYGLFAFLSAAVLAIMPVPIQLALAEGLRARGTAIISLLMSAMAGTLGPLFVGLCMDIGGVSLAVALSVMMAVSSAMSVACFARAVAVRNDPVT